MSTMTTTPPVAKRSPCSCHEEKPAPCTCCGITCFERPNYFCGHLLTDADLSLEQKYLIEKNKLYHRTIDGYGIACGLKVTCDCDCRGHVLIHQGFAIDDCGHDLVVCETTRFNVIGALKKKGWLVFDEPEDECEPEEEEEEAECKIKQCFYLTICYDETQSCYETPFQSSCTSGPKECLPTRVKEGYRIDLARELPPEHSYLTDLRRRFAHCFQIHRKGEIGEIMSEPKNLKMLEKILSGQFADWKPEEWDACNVFCTLRAWFLNRLKIKPDEFNCGLFEQVQCLTCPDDYEGKQNGAGWTEYCDDLQEAFRELIILIERYQLDCAMGELIFSCEQPCEAHCLVLGTVEVLDGKLIRVCNTPRRYLWTPANLIPVLFYNLLYERGECREHDEDEDKGRNKDKDKNKVCCCPSYDRFLPEEFIKEFRYRKEGRYLAAISATHAFEAVVESLRRSFDFTDTKRFSPVLFEELERTPELGVHVQTSDRFASDLSPANAVEALLGNALLHPGDSVARYRTREGAKVATIIPNSVREISRDRSIGEKIEDDLEKLNRAVDQAKEALKQVQELRNQIGPLLDKGQQKKGPQKGASPGGPEEPKPEKPK